jgi:hypothetical protein
VRGIVQGGNTGYAAYSGGNIGYAAYVGGSIGYAAYAGYVYTVSRP